MRQPVAGDESTKAVRKGLKLALVKACTRMLARGVC
jgi:hypothetical protein